MIFNGTNIEAWCGETDAFTVECIDQDTGNPVPFVDGDTVYFTIKSDVNDEATEVLQKTITSFIAGKAKIVVEHEDTADLSPREYQYDCWLYKQDGQAFPIIELADFILKRGATNE